jgi:hypothetical protein
LPGRAAGFARRHAVFGAILLAAAAVRAIVMLGYPGPLLYPDTGPYLSAALRLVPGQLNPSGYSFMLRLLEPFNSLAVVVGVQHAMGLGVGVLGYALLRRFGLPGWGAALAMVPVLLSAYAIQIEHFLLSDTLFGFLVMVAVTVMLWWRDPPLWACALAGLLLAAAAIVRVQGVPLLIVFVACLLIRFAGWRTLASVAVICVAFAVPTAAYAAWFDHWYGSFRLTNSDGFYLYAEVTTFADCAKIHPPADLRRMCLNVPVSEREAYAPYYMWVWKANPLRGVPWSTADRLGNDFAFRAIRAEPLDYLQAVEQNFAQSFLLHSGHPREFTIAWAGAQSQRDYMFPAGSPIWSDANFDRYFREYQGALPNLRKVQPYAGWIQTYQRFIVVSGPLLGLIALTGLVGLIVSWRRIGGPALLPWLTGITLLAAPALILFDVRFIVCVIPPLCVAAAIGVEQIVGRIRSFGAGRRQPAL